MKYLSIFSFAFMLLINARGQTEEIRNEFFRQRIDSIVEMNKKFYQEIEISGVRIKWDATKATVKYILKGDITGDTFASRMRNQTKEFRSKLSSIDSSSFVQQLANQDIDPFIDQQRIKGEVKRKKRECCYSIQFSQPLVFNEGNEILVWEQYETELCWGRAIMHYKFISGGWVRVGSFYAEQACT